MTVFRVVIQALDDTDTLRTLVFEDGRGRSLLSTDTPASVYAEPRLAEVPSLRRGIYSQGVVGGSARLSVGRLRLLNADGGLDYLRTWAVDGQSLKVYWSASPSATFPGSWVEVQSLTMRQHTVGLEYVDVEMDDGRDRFQRPIQDTLYDGDNVLPAGLEGVEDLEGKPKPALFGSVRNIAPPEVNTARLIYQVNDGAVQSVPAVYDRGILLSGGGEWETRNIPGTISTRSGVAHHNGRWVVVGGNTIYTSDNDGGTWTLRATVGSSLRNVIYAPGFSLWIAVGGSLGNPPDLYTSSDGVTWTSRTSGFSTGEAIYGVAWSQELGIAVIVGDNGRLASSTNGTSWTLRTSGITGTIFTVAASERRFVALGYESGNAIGSSSTNGTSWSTGGFAGISQPVFPADLQYGGGKWVLVGNGSGSDEPRMAASIDGLAWSWRGEDFVGIQQGFSPAVASVAYYDGRWVVVGFTGYIGVSSNPDQAFTRVQNPATDQQLVKVRAGSETLMAVGGSGGGPATVVVALKPGTYASQADLLDDTLSPAPGTFKAYLVGGLIRLGAPPDGAPTADVVQGANTAARTPGQSFAAILQRVGLTAGTAAGNYSSADITALDAIVGAECGWWTGTQERRVADLLDITALSARAWWGVDRRGVYRIRRIVDPSTVSPVLTLVADEVFDLRALDAPLPARSVTVAYSRNHTPQGDELSFAVEAARKADLGQPWREVEDADASVATRHPLSQERRLETILQTRAGAVTRAADEVALYDTRREVWEFSTNIRQATLEVDLGDVIEWTDPRLGVLRGLVVTVDPDPVNNRVRWGVWL